MSLNPAQIKNSQTAARAVLNIMAHYGIQPLSYKPGTFAEFMLLALKVFTDDRGTALKLEERVDDLLQELQTIPTTRAVGVMLTRALVKSALNVGGRTAHDLTVADLLFTSRGKGYRYTKIVGGRDFKVRIDETLVGDMRAFTADGEITSLRLSFLLAHMVKLDLYTHFYRNALPTVATLPALQPYDQATLYLALKSFLMAKRDVFDPSLEEMGGTIETAQIQALQRFLQLHGIYRFSDWFPQTSSFLTGQFIVLRNSHDEVTHIRPTLSSPEDVDLIIQMWSVNRKFY